MHALVFVAFLYNYVMLFCTHACMHVPRNFEIMLRKLEISKLHNYMYL